MLFLVVATLIVGVVTYGFYRISMHISAHSRDLDYKDETKIPGKTVIITGANSGLGKATATELAVRGARVLMGCRDRAKGDAAAEEIKKATGNDEVIVFDLDLADLDSVKAAAQKINNTESRLDVLINNAGVGSTDEICTKQGFDYIFGTNYIGHFLLTNLLLDLLKKTAPSRIINVSSAAHYGVQNELDFTPVSDHTKVRYPNLSGYMISKLANILHATHLTEELKGTGVTANAMSPGFVKTRIMYKEVNDFKTNMFNKFCKFIVKFIGRSGKVGSQTIVFMAVDQSLTEVSGEYFENLGKGEILSKLAKDKEQARKLWEMSHIACGNYLNLPESMSNVEGIGAFSTTESSDATEDDLTKTKVAPTVTATTTTTAAEVTTEIKPTSTVDTFSAATVMATTLSDNTFDTTHDQFAARIASSEPEFQPLILPEITETNEHYPIQEVMSSLERTTETCSAVATNINESTCSFKDNKDLLSAGVDIMEDTRETISVIYEGPIEAEEVSAISEDKETERSETVSDVKSQFSSDIRCEDDNTACGNSSD